MKYIWTAFVLLAGSFLPIQAAMNGKVGKALGSSEYASLLSFIVGTITLLAYILIARVNGNLSVNALKDIPPYAWTAGVLGAFYVTVVILAFPRLGLPLTFGLIVAGQMITSVSLDHFKILVEHQRSVSLIRVVGVLFIITGVIIIRKY